MPKVLKSHNWYGRAYVTTAKLFQMWDARTQNFFYRHDLIILTIFRKILIDKKSKTSGEKSQTMEFNLINLVYMRNSFWWNY